MKKYQTMISAVFLVCLLTACTSEQDKFVQQCMKDELAERKANSAIIHNEHLSVNCNEQFPRELHRETMISECSSIQKDKYGFWPVPLTEQLVMPTVNIDGGQKFNCYLCTSGARQPGCTDEGLAACWQHEKNRCEEKEKSSRDSCEDYKRQKIVRGPDSITITEQELREVCLRRSKG